MENIAENLAQQQLDAYNNGDIEAFLINYHQDVSVKDFPSNEVVYSGLDNMRERYSKLFMENPNQHARLLTRIVQGNVVVDHEHVTGRANGKEVYAMAIYEVINDKIATVWFKR
ncbi:MAG: nuclear transport factor 2 family protein [Bacillus sp. (in: Bacteria)]|nr:nuclear transport factor 2 family protein [Bacillus sp. (in: firmicutes)]